MGVSSLVIVVLALTKQNADIVSKIALITNLLLFVAIVFGSVSSIYYLMEAVVFKYMISIY